jgi:hypothetical protein
VFIGIAKARTAPIKRGSSLNRSLRVALSDNILAYLGVVCYHPLHQVQIGLLRGYWQRLVVKGKEK